MHIFIFVYSEKRTICKEKTEKTGKNLCAYIFFFIDLLPWLYCGGVYLADLPTTEFFAKIAENRGKT